MFYAHFVLAKKGPLARIWLAAHWDKKLTKAHVFETNIEKSVDGILQPKVKMALRTSGHLLLGVVRIYSRKAKYLLADCNEAFVKIKMAFRPGMVDLPEENREAAVNAITLPEVFHDFDTAMPELNDVDIEAQFSLNQSRAEEITMREDYGSITLVTSDEGFGDMGFDAEPPELIRHVSSLEPSLDQTSLLFSDGPAVEHMAQEREPQPSTSGAPPPRTGLDIEAPIRDDGFGGNLGQDIIAGGLFEGGLFDEAPMPTEVPAVEPQLPPVDEPEKMVEEPEHESEDEFGGPPSVGGRSSDGESRPATPLPEPPPPELPEPTLPPPSEPPYPPDQLEDQGMAGPDQTTLLQNEEESFALAPVDASALRGFTKTKRKRKLIVDEVKNISGEEMKAQLSDTSDIVTTLDLAPPTKRLMHWKETGGVEKLFALPGRPILAKTLSKNYNRHLVSRPAENYDFGTLGDEDDLALEQVREADGAEPLDASRRAARKRKLPEGPEDLQASKRLAEEAVAPSDVELQQLMAAAPPTPFMPPPPSTPQPFMPPPTPQPFMPPTATTPQAFMPVAPPTPQPFLPPTPLPQETQPELVGPPADVEMPQLPPDQVSSLLEEGLEQPAPPEIPAVAVVPEPETIPPPPEEQLPQMENMGYDLSGTLLANMGYDEQHPPAQTPGAISERGVATPWHEDYEFPPSVGAPEEQQVDETYEQFEERVLNKRASHMYHIVKSKLSREDKPLFFSEMVQRNNNRKQVAQKFYTLLVLKKHCVLELKQEASYDEILIERGPKFDDPSL